MKVRILQTVRGSPDGIEIREYEAGKKYDLPPSLAKIFLDAGWAEEDKELMCEVKDEIKTGNRAGSRAGKPGRGKKPPKG